PQTPGAANAASQTTPTGTASGTQQGAQPTTPAGAQTITKTEALATQPAGAAPPQTASPASPGPQGPVQGTGPGRSSSQQPKTKQKSVDTSLLPTPRPVPKLVLPTVQRRKL